MKKLQLLVLAMFIHFGAIAQTNWVIDPSHSNIVFTVKHMVISEVSGSFQKFDAEVISNGEEFENAIINFTADVNSIFTDNEKRDGHLRADDFFDAEKYPELTFKGKSLKKVSGNKYKLTGDLTIKGITKEIVLDVEFGGIATAWGQTKAGFKISGEINRFDFGLEWNSLTEAGGVVVGDKVKINCNVQIVKQ